MIAGIQFHLQCQDPASQRLLGNPSIQLLLSGGEYTTRSLSFNLQHDLTLSDLTVEDHMYIFLKPPKSDRPCQGTQIIIASFCSFSSMMKCLHHCSLTPWLASLFITDDYKPMTRSWFSLKLPELQSFPRTLFPSLPENRCSYNCSSPSAYLDAKILEPLVILSFQTLHQAPQEGDLVRTKAHELLHPLNASINIGSYLAV